jgi:polyferredoxin
LYKTDDDLSFACKVSRVAEERLMKISNLVKAIFFLGLALAVLVALAISAFNLSAKIGWVAFAVFAAAMLLNGLIIRHEDKLPGSFYSPKRKEQEPKSH